jgi:hypothetical protein
MSLYISRIFLCVFAFSLAIVTACGDEAVSPGGSQDIEPDCGENAQLSEQEICVCLGGYEYCENGAPESGCCETEEPTPPRDPYCADSICNGQETPANCPRDCTEDAECGDGTCQPSETPANCAQDCVTPPICGNGVCETGETTARCSADVRSWQHRQRRPDSDWRLSGPDVALRLPVACQCNLSVMHAYTHYY